MSNSIRWLKSLNIEFANGFPYLKVEVELVNDSDVDVMFNTVSLLQMKLWIDGRSVDLGDYHYMGKHMDRPIRPSEKLKLTGLLKICDLSAHSIRQIFEEIKRVERLAVELRFMLYYSDQGEYQDSKITLSREVFLKWIKKDLGNVETDFLSFHYTIPNIIRLLKQENRNRRLVEAKYMNLLETVAKTLAILEMLSKLFATEKARQPKLITNKTKYSSGEDVIASGTATPDYYVTFIIKNRYGNIVWTSMLKSNPHGAYHGVILRFPSEPTDDFPAGEYIIMATDSYTGVTVTKRIAYIP